MKIERFENIEAWQLVRDLIQKVYRLTKKVFLETLNMKGTSLHGRDQRYFFTRPS